MLPYSVYVLVGLSLPTILPIYLRQCSGSLRTENIGDISFDKHLFSSTSLCRYDDAMPTENVSHVLDGPNTEEAQGLLSVSASDQDAEGLVHHEPIPPQIPHHSRRQSSISRPAVKGSPRAPRTNNRVRFDIEERRSNDHTATNERQSADSEGSSWMEEEDFMSHSTNGVRSGTGQRVPLLTFSPNRIVASADAVNFDLEDLLESARPKSGLGSAFFNMANSIM